MPLERDDECYQPAIEPEVREGEQHEARKDCVDWRRFFYKRSDAGNVEKQMCGAPCGDRWCRHIEEGTMRFIVALREPERDHQPVQRNDDSPRGWTVQQDGGENKGL